MKNVVKFEQHPFRREGSGYYYSTLESDKQKGWFGTQTEPDYYFEKVLVNGKWKFRSSGKETGNFWAD